MNSECYEKIIVIDIKDAVTISQKQRVKKYCSYDKARFIGPIMNRKLTTNTFIYKRDRRLIH